MSNVLDDSNFDSRGNFIGDNPLKGLPIEENPLFKKVQDGPFEPIFRQVENVLGNSSILTEELEK